MPDTAETAILTLLTARADDATLCPSEVARVLATDPARWRPEMPRVHAAVDRLVAQGAVRLSWKGATLPARGGAVSDWAGRQA